MYDFKLQTTILRSRQRVPGMLRHSMLCAHVYIYHVVKHVTISIWVYK